MSNTHPSPPLAPDIRRLFVAIALDEILKDTLAKALPPASPDVKPESAENLHLTLHFLGPQPLERVSEALATIAVPAFDLHLGELGSFEARDGSTVLWAAVDGGEGLTALHLAVAAALAPLGFAPERRPYRPHITLARCMAGGAVTVGKLLDQTPPRGAQLITSFSLFSSSFGQGDKVVYQEERVFPLQPVG